MNQLNTTKTAYVFAIIFGGFHAFWALLIALGFAQTLIDFIFTLHMIVPFYQVAPFNIMIAVSLVVFTSLVGLIVGYIFARVWNKLHKA